jgi:hypothetical protein
VSWLKVRFLCADEEQAVEDALREFLTEAADQASVKLSIIERKKRRIQESLTLDNPIRQRLWENFQWRLSQQIEYCRDTIRCFREYTLEPKTLDPKNEDVLSAAAQATMLLAEAGIPPQSVEKSFKQLSRTLTALQQVRERYLLA